MTYSEYLLSENLKAAIASSCRNTGTLLPRGKEFVEIRAVTRRVNINRTKTRRKMDKQEKKKTNGSLSKSIVVVVAALEFNCTEAQLLDLFIPSVSRCCCCFYASI